MKKPLWRPTGADIEKSNMMKYIHYVNKKHNLQLTDYQQLYQWSIKQNENFWLALWEFSDIQYSDKIIQVLDYDKSINQVTPGADWFIGTRLNFAENLLRFDDAETAIIAYNEKGEKNEITYSELREKTAALQFNLKQLQVGIGDRVAAIVSNIPESVIAMLSTTSIGAVWSSTSPDMGASAVLERFKQVNPKILFAVDGYLYNGRNYSNIDTINRIKKELTDTKIVIIPKILTKKEISGQLDFTPLFWDELINERGHTEPKFLRLDFLHPVYILFSSGTTGRPKCIVHGAGGTLLQHYKELALHTNLQRDDKIFYFTTCAWMMWNWLISSLFTGASIVLYDGSPAYPDINTLWKMIDELGITVFGTSPKYLSSSQDSNIHPGNDYDLSSLKTILSTGAPLTTRNFEWVYKTVKQDVRLSSISGGTDIISCFALGNPILPVYSGELQCIGLGMKVEAFDTEGNSVINQKGELVCTAIFPSMPIYFLDDINGSVYHRSYFDIYPNVWHHGDYIEITSHGSVIVYGRSDATLNPGGIRIGTAEIYHVVEALDCVIDSIAVGLEENNDTSIVLFVVLSDDIKLDDKLVEKIKSEIGNNLTPRHIPKYIRQIKEVPLTLNGKKVELSVKRIINGNKDEVNTALANPKSLEQFKNMKF